MKALKTFSFLVCLLAMATISHAQAGISPVQIRALNCADSLESAYDHHNWNDYLALCYPGLVAYYGGAESFMTHIYNIQRTEESNVRHAKLEVIQMERATSEWQCVVRRTYNTVVDGVKAEIISYLVGQSKDDGMTWKFVDVGSNTPENVVYMMPDVFEKLAIPQREVVLATAPAVAATN